ncbi:MAG TPA: sigma-70 region 4 domain-containing protein [Solirubrobacteraceae bacterium]|nr:sigma-70 region 4 domain-containing protein [Solirubrobacteraceae bacterium]
MSRLDELPPDQRAALSLLLRQRKSYADVAALLGIGERAVHDRAHAALAVLAPRRARELTPELRLQVGDYLLGQQPGVAERLRTRTLLASSEPARAWAAELAAQLQPLAGANLPEVPAAAASPAGGAPGAAAAQARGPQRVSDLAVAAGAAAAGAGAGPGQSAAASPLARARQQPSSRLGGALLLLVLLAAVIVAVVLITGGSGSGKAKTTATTTTGSSKSGPTVENEIPMKPPSGANSASVGVVDVVSDAGKTAFIIDAQHLPRARGFYYAIWLYNSPTSFQALSRSSHVGKSHALEGGSALPADASQFHEILLTKETKPRPSHPGKVILRGTFSLR